MVERVERERSIGEMTPVRLAEWSEREGVIVIECPKPGGPWYRELAAWFSWWTGPQRIKLDEVGSECWLLFDGCRTLEDIARTISEKRPDDREKLDTRISLFLNVLIDRRMVRLD